MKRILTATAVTICSTGVVFAGGIDRSGQPIDILFKDGNYGEVSVVHTTPEVGGSDLPQSPPGFPFSYDSGQSYKNATDDFTSYGFGIKYDVNDRLTLALTGAEDFGSDIEYEDEPGSLLGGTLALADTYTLRLLARYSFTENWSVHGGIRRSVASGNIKLGGLAYGQVNGYEVELDDDVGYGYLVGAAYEIPDIALRIAVTYNSKIRHDFKSTETLNGTSLGSSDATNVDTPQAVNVDFQTGIAENTLLFGGIRWAEWSEFRIAPENFEALTGTGLVSLEDTTTYTLGVGRRFTEKFAASASVIYENAGDDLVSPLAPTNGLIAVALGASYLVNNVEISGGVRYAWLGDAKPETGTPDVARADFTDNTAVSIGLKLGYYF